MLVRTHFLMYDECSFYIVTLIKLKMYDWDLEPNHCPVSKCNSSCGLSSSCVFVTISSCKIV